MARLQDGGHPYIHSISPSKGSREQYLRIDGPFPGGKARPQKDGEQVSWLFSDCLSPCMGSAQDISLAPTPPQGTVRLGAGD